MDGEGCISREHTKTFSERTHHSAGIGGYIVKNQGYSLVSWVQLCVKKCQAHKQEDMKMRNKTVPYTPLRWVQI